MKKVVVIGSGISGLATAVRLLESESAEPLEVTVLDSSTRPGGNIHSDRVDGYTIEQGPNGYLDNAPTTRDLVHRLALENQLQKADESAAKRFLFRNGKLRKLATGPLSFLGSSVLSVPGRLRVLLEPFARQLPEGKEETIHEFASRRIGREAAEVLIDAMVSGVYGGDIRKLSLASTFPKMATMEAEHGGLVRAMIAKGKERKTARQRAAAMRERGEDPGELTQPGGPAGPGGTLTSFTDGLDRLVYGAASRLGERLRLRTTVRAVAFEPNGDAPGRWTVYIADGDRLNADAVIVALPAAHAVPLLEGIDGPLAAAAAEIESAGLAIVALGYDAQSLGGAPNGFGFLVPRSEGIRSLGCLWDSSIFPGRAPSGKVLLRVILGGAHDPQVADLDDQTLARIAREDLKTTMALTADPELMRVYRHPLGIAQYNLGHGERMRNIHDRLADLPGLWLAGSSYYGVSMNSCIEKAASQAGKIIAYLQNSS